MAQGIASKAFPDVKKKRHVWNKRHGARDVAVEVKVRKARKATVSLITL